MTLDQKKKSGNHMLDLLMNNGGIITAKTRVFEERYSGGVLDLNIFCFAFIDENEGSSAIMSAGSSM